MLSGSPNAAFASIHTYPEGADQVMWRSLQTLRNDSDQTWQVIFYKRVTAGQIDSLNLRLVGFPGGAALMRSAPLEITTGIGKSWTAPEIATVSLLPLNVGEYDLRSLITQLASNTALQLTLPLQQQRVVKLLVPPFVVKEWRQTVELTQEQEGLP